jgi:hypothetical protein
MGALASEFEKDFSYYLCWYLMVVVQCVDIHVAQVRNPIWIVCVTTTCARPPGGNLGTQW